MTKHVHCPHCGQTVPWTPESRWRPFCSERCRLIDLGDWLEERHCIPVVANDYSTEAEAALCCEPPAISHQHH